MIKSATILIVEDDVWTAEQHVRTLTTAGYKASYVTNALEAIEAIDAHQPSLVILDLLLTGQNAFALLHELRSHVDLSGIPVILCTNSAESLAEEDSRVYGVQCILDKTTMRPEDLIAAVKKVLL